MKKTIIAFFVLLMYLLILSVCASAGNYSIQTEEMLISAMNLSSHEWETSIAEKRKEGLENQLEMEAIQAADAQTKFYTQDGRIYSIQGNGFREKIENPLDAYRCVYRLLSLLGGADTTTLELWSVLSTDVKTFYVFQQVHDGLTVVASTVKLVTDKDNNVCAVFSSLSGNEPESHGEKEINPEEAEAAVKAYLENSQMNVTILSEFTNKVIIPIEGDIDDNVIYPDQVVWVVYTQNPRFGSTHVVDMPYLAHYVQMDGTYLYNNPVTMPRDMASISGYSSIYTFEFMEADEWKGEVTYSNGKTREITVPVMRDSRTNAFYLGDVERKIVIGDFATMAYGEKKVKLLVGNENQWDDADLITYANFIKVWDYYARIGWVGPDGTGTPTILLRNLCEEDGTPIENAAYVGKSQGWQCFAYSKTGSLGQCLDVFAHEFTHCVTSTLMNTNLYQDDWGAINEAMSDIMGNICELSEEDTEDTEWLIGENGELGVVRSMSNPHEFGQPEYVWDVFYVPHTQTPNDVNDRGGVHYNSSILNRVGALLCMEGDMSLDEARDFWMTVACGLTPKTDYPQMVTLLSWALEASGNGKYQPKLDELIASGAFERTEIPETLPEGQHLAILEIPETEAFEDTNWVIWVMQIDTEEIGNRFGAILRFLARIVQDDGTSDFAKELEEVLTTLHMDGLKMSFDSEDAKDDEFSSILGQLLDGIVTQHFSWRQTGTNRMPMVLNNRLTLYMLMNADEDGMEMNRLAVLVGDRWFDVTAVLEEDEEAAEKVFDSVLFDEQIGKLTDMLMDLFLNGGKIGEIPPVEMIPVKGLELIRMPEKPSDPERTEESSADLTKETEAGSVDHPGETGAVPEALPDAIPADLSETVEDVPQVLPEAA